MAKFSLVIDDDLEDILDNVEQELPEIEKKMLEAEADLFLPVAKKNLETAVGSGTKYESRSTGELVASIGISKAKQMKSGTGYDISVGFNEPRRKQYAPQRYHLSRTGHKVANRGYYEVTNALIANVLEHGKSGQRPKPWMAPARIAMEEPCREEAQRVYDNEVERLKKK